jgi:hypothetical protein
MTTQQNRQPSENECFAALVTAMLRLGGRCDRTRAAIQDQVVKVDFASAAHALDVEPVDLIEAFKIEMRGLGFIIRQGPRPH